MKRYHLSVSSRDLAIPSILALTLDMKLLYL